MLVCLKLFLDSTIEPLLDYLSHLLIELKLLNCLLQSHTERGVQIVNITFSFNVLRGLVLLLLCPWVCLRCVVTLRHKLLLLLGRS